MLVRSGFAGTGLVFIALMAVAGLAHLAPGEGVHHRLDASAGLDHERFYASLRKAKDKMSQSQSEAIDWALDGVAVEAFVNRFGEAPTVRQIVIREVARVVDAKRPEIAALETRLAGMQTALEQSKTTRLQALASLRSYAPRIVRVGYPDPSEFDANARVSSCGKDDCPQDGVRDEGLFVFYRMDNTANADLATLPCRLTYRVADRARKGERDFDCLRQQKMPNGTYYVRLASGRIGDTSADVFVSIEALHERAQVRHPTLPWKLVDALPGLLPEFEKLQLARKQMKQALGYKSVM